MHERRVRATVVALVRVRAEEVALGLREVERQALGADPRSILSLVLSQGMLRAGIGVVIGLGASVMFTRVLESLLFGVKARDLSVFGGVTVLLLVVSALACYIPARRATRIDPMIALRDS